MHKSRITIQGNEYPLIQLKVLVIGSGAAGLNAAVQLYERGIESVAILTDKWGGGTSNNAGSDKQTYYRLDPFNPEGDSVNSMAASLASGGCMHGDVAMAEAAGSLQAFYHLVQAGVPFPHDDLGRFPGYQTDHDTKGRGTSAGPLTSRFMFEKLAAKVVEARIPILDNRVLIRLLTESNEGNISLTGCVVLNQEHRLDALSAVEIIRADYVVLATGGAGELFEQSVYPAGQYGATGLAIEAGARAQNLTEFQFGIASLQPRWNLSGSYQQVVPAYYSLDEHGNRHNFLNPSFPDPKKLTKAIFLKGYQWPFDPNKIKESGSSLIDLLVYHQSVVLNRKVYMDFRSNPVSAAGMEITPDEFDPEVLDYLSRSDALKSSPLARLSAMNQPAVNLYRSKGLDLAKNPVEIGVCAQHCNGGISGSVWWESSVNNLFVIGEANGSHGVYRPGGSALNSGQVGGFRAAQMIASRVRQSSFKTKGFSAPALDVVTDLIKEIFILANNNRTTDLEQEWGILKSRTTAVAGILRNSDRLHAAINEIHEQRERIKECLLQDTSEVTDWFRIKEQLTLQEAIFFSLKAYCEAGGESRGSFLIVHPAYPETIPGLENLGFRLDPENGFTRNHLLSLYIKDNQMFTDWIPVRQIPNQKLWFEQVWNDFREKRIIK